MATFIQGLTDYIPKVEPYRPDFDFLNKVLSTKQAKYDSAINQLSGIYGSIIYSDLTREDNIQSRNNFLQNAQKNIQQITSMDLSDPKNVQLAQKVFEPFIQDKKLQYDIMFTKSASSAKKTAEYLRTSSDPKLVGQYWNEGIRAVDYRTLEFKNAAPDKAYTMALPKYTPYVNIMAKAKELVGDEFKDISIEEQRGNYLVTTKGGPKSINVINQFLTETLGQDPSVKAYATEKAYVQSMDNIFQLAQSKYNGDINLAKSEYYLTNTEAYIANDENRLSTIESGLNAIDAKIDIYKSRIDRGGKLSQKEQQEYAISLAKKQQYENASKSVSERINQLRDAVTSEDIDLLSRVGLSSAATSFINNEISKASDVQAYKDFQVSVKEDPYRLKAYEAALDFSYWKQKTKIDQDFEREMKMLELGGFDDFSSTSVRSEAAETDAFSGDRNEFNNSWKNYNNSMYEMVSSLYNIDDPNIQNAVAKVLKSSNVTMDQLKNNQIGLTGLNNVFDKINDIIKADPNLLRNMAGFVKTANDQRQLAASNITSIANNNKVIMANMMASKSYVPSFLEDVFTSDGHLRDRETAYRNAVKRRGYTIDKDEFMDDYDNFFQEYSEQYTDLSKNKTGYVPVGRSAAGQYISNAVSGVADFERPLSKVTSGFREVLDNALNSDSRIAVGSPADVAKESGRDFTAIEDVPELRGYLNNLISEAKANKSKIAFSYQGRALGSPDYESLTIRPSMSDPIMKQLKETNENLYNNILQKGVTVVMPVSAANSYISQRISTPDREVILNNTGRYTYMNPTGDINITFTKNKNQTISASGTAYNPRTGAVETYMENNLNVITFNELINQFDNIK